MTDPTEAEMDALDIALDGLEAHVKAEWGWPTVHPANQRKYDRDIGGVTDARGALAALRAQVAGLEAERDAALAEVVRLREALTDISTDKREYGDDEVAIIYRMQDRANAALAPRPAPTDEIAAAARVLLESLGPGPGSPPDELLRWIVAFNAGADARVTSGPWSGLRATLRALAKGGA